MHIKRIIGIVFLISSTFFLSCSSTIESEILNTTPNEEIKKSREIVEDTEEEIEDSADIIEDSAKEIKSSAQDIRDFVPPEVKEIVEPDVNNIEDHSDIIQLQTLELRLMRKRLSDARGQMIIAANKVDQIEEQVKEIIKEKNKLEKERDKAIASQKDGTKNILRWLIVASVIAGGVSIALMVFGNVAVGSMLLAGSVATMGLAIAVEQYLEWIAIGGLVVIGAAAIYAVYQIYIRQKALKEVVHTTEVAKRRMPSTERKNIFGYREEPGMAMSIQSKPTEKLIQNMRKKLKKNWDHTIGDEDSRQMDEFDRQQKQIQENVNRGRGNLVTNN